MSALFPAMDTTMTRPSIRGLSIVRRIVVVVPIVCLLCVAGSRPAAGSLEVAHVATISEGLAAPMSLVLYPEGIAVLEPYADRIVLYGDSGIKTKQIDIAGDAMGLCRLSGSVYLFCDRSMKQVVEVDVRTGSTGTFLGSNADLIDPIDLFVDGGNGYILDAGKSEIVVLTIEDRTVVGRIPLILPDGAPIGGASCFTAVRAPDLRFYVFEQLTSTVHLFDLAEGHVGSFCSYGAAAGKVTRGGDVAWSAQGYLYVSDRYQGRVAVFDGAGRFVGEIDLSRFLDADLLVPTGLAVDADGLLYVASTEAGRIDVFSIGASQDPDYPFALTLGMPAEDDTVAADQVRFDVTLSGVARWCDAALLDFRVLASTDTNDVHCSTLNREPAEKDCTESQSNLRFTWEPETPFVEGNPYWWQVRVRSDDWSGAWTSLNQFEVGRSSIRFALEQNHPNPFRGGTHLVFRAPSATHAQVRVFSVSGRLIWERVVSVAHSGRHDLYWPGRDGDGNRVAPGLYFFRVDLGDETKSRKMLMMR